MKCDYIAAAKTMCGKTIACAPGGCPHYGNCLPVIGIRETPPQAVGADTAQRGKYYHNTIEEGIYE